MGYPSISGMGAPSNSSSLKRRPSNDDIAGSSYLGGGGRSVAAYGESEMTNGRARQIYENQRLYEKQQAAQAMADRQEMIRKAHAKQQEEAQRKMRELSRPAAAPPATAVREKYDDRDLPRTPVRKNYETTYYPDHYSTDSDDLVIDEGSDYDDKH